MYVFIKIFLKTGIRVKRKMKEAAVALFDEIGKIIRRRRAACARYGLAPIGVCTTELSSKNSTAAVALGGRPRRS